MNTANPAEYYGQKLNEAAHEALGIPVPEQYPTYFERALVMIAEMHHRKAADYTNGGEFDNFNESARFAGINTDQAIENLIGTKNARLASLRGRPPLNESKFDTYFDRAVYSIIAMAYQLMLRETDKTRLESKQREAQAMLNQRP